MLDIKYIREHADEIAENCKKRRVNVDIFALLGHDERRRAATAEIDGLRSERKKGSKSKPSEENIAAMRLLGETLKEKEKALQIIAAEGDALLAKVPNLTHPHAPVGGEKDFKVMAERRNPPSFGFEPKDHETLFTDLDCLDFERGAKVAGAKFYFAKNDLVRLNQALIRYGMDAAGEEGYVPLETPDVAKNDILLGVGFQPRGPESQVYGIEGSDLSLIGTAEITAGGYHANEVLDLSQGPKKYMALSHCFRTEAGAYGRESRGLYRVHQFTKLELFVLCDPAESEAMHEELLAIERKIADGLKLSYRVIDIASADLGAPAYRKYDIEAYMVMKNGYGEITSTSNCTDYQSRQLNIKYRKSNGTADYVHTLNGTAIVTSRFPIVIAEQYQLKDGSIEIPKALRAFMGKKKISKMK